MDILYPLLWQSRLSWHMEIPVSAGVPQHGPPLRVDLASHNATQMPRTNRRGLLGSRHSCLIMLVNIQYAVYRLTCKSKHGKRRRDMMRLYMIILVTSHCTAWLSTYAQNVYTVCVYLWWQNCNFLCGKLLLILYRCPPPTTHQTCRNMREETIGLAFAQREFAKMPGGGHPWAYWLFYQLWRQVLPTTPISRLRVVLLNLFKSILFKVDYCKYERSCNFLGYYGIYRLLAQSGSGY